MCIIISIKNERRKIMKIISILRNEKYRYRFYLLIFLIVLLSLYLMTYMPGKSYSGNFPEPTTKQLELAKKYHEQVIYFASEPHNSTHYKALWKTEQFIENTLKENGFKNITVQTYQPIQFKNYEVVIEPKNKATQTVVIGAHYDSAGEAPGADDNGSSVVILLELAKRFHEQFNNNNTRLRIVFFTNEEPPFFKSSLMGSAKYARYLYEIKEPVIAMYAFDAMGYYKEEKGTQHYPFMFAPFYSNKGNFIGFVGNLSSRKLVVDSLTAFRKDAKFPSEGVSALQYIPGIDFSDHVSFYYYNWPALMITDTAFNRNETYHKKTDTPETLDYIKMAQLTDELEKMFRQLYEK